jgi:hypothetical protein
MEGWKIAKEESLAHALAIFMPPPFRRQSVETRKLVISLHFDPNSAEQKWFISTNRTQG